MKRGNLLKKENLKLYTSLYIKKIYFNESLKVITEYKGSSRLLEVVEYLSEVSLNRDRSEADLGETASRSGRRRTTRFAVTERV